jgi:hypothetical protein
MAIIAKKENVPGGLSGDIFLKASILSPGPKRMR